MKTFQELPFLDVLYPLIEKQIHLYELHFSPIGNEHHKVTGMTAKWESFNLQTVMWYSLGLAIMVTFLRLSTDSTMIKNGVTKVFSQQALNSFPLEGNKSGKYI